MPSWARLNSFPIGFERHAKRHWHAHHRAGLRAGEGCLARRAAGSARIDRSLSRWTQFALFTHGAGAGAGRASSARLTALRCRVETLTCAAGAGARSPLKSQRGHYHCEEKRPHAEHASGFCDPHVSVAGEARQRERVVTTVRPESLQAVHWSTFQPLKRMLWSFAPRFRAPATCCSRIVLGVQENVEDTRGLRLGGVLLSRMNGPELPSCAKLARWLEAAAPFVFKPA